ncbi:Cof-type HAD-IIB family hydrolase [Brachyspira hyodysenteriae]|uniref:Hydrolase n=1 Tax=Brachyspira hyodysenteriae ATCC 27164 TaxID=1266923 RepID=A0A3B6VWD2_BRAHO|nr:Cof-type HAD-IIB family hydrolase [Brachyspira hyodysenteriae]ANN64039.1 hydrolase [Brachyspira hyodysenteriae ATCC 27164]KLI14446.1 hydrolase [Brachyspira hyodysenteriae]KLI15158.1 hydrolase [Brachyspira hyodysenteriae]KLI25685.1 hydrolase [Brachyspira hyodysenteriae]KLI28374.1 hydrolase [Brachyspira hyodysenteriae]
MNNIQLIATDLDGTLLNNNHQISEYNKNIIKAASKKGIKTILSTGRPTSAAIKFLYDLDIDTELISFNGAMITDKNSNIIYQENLNPKIGIELINIAKKYNIYHQGFLGDRWNIGFFDNKWTNFYISIAQIDNYIIGFDNIEDFSFSKFMFIGENHILKNIAEELNRTFGNSIYYAFSRPVYLEVHSPNASKANALKYLADKYNINSDNIMAFGDNNNDLEMLEFVGISVAVENAEDIVKLKSLYTAKSNEENGVGIFINDMLNLNI